MRLCRSEYDVEKGRYGELLTNTKGESLYFFTIFDIK